MVHTLFAALWLDLGHEASPMDGFKVVSEVNEVGHNSFLKTNINYSYTCHDQFDITTVTLCHLFHKLTTFFHFFYRYTC